MNPKKKGPANNEPIDPQTVVDALNRGVKENEAKKKKGTEEPSPAKEEGMNG